MVHAASPALRPGDLRRSRWLVGAAGPGPFRGLPDSDYYRSRVVSMTPAVAGLSLTVDTSGENLTLTNGTGGLVEVPGYVIEPYLRFTGTQVEQNTNSISAFLNGTLVIEGLPQQAGAADKPPVWKVVSTTNSYSWHDHRTHWMAQQRPPTVAADPTAPHLVFAWQVPLRVAGSPVTVDGELSWIGEPAISSQTLTVLALGVTGLLVAGVVMLRRRAVRRPALDPAPSGLHAESPAESPTDQPVG